MGKSVLKVRGYGANEIKNLFTKNPSYMIGIRLYIIYQVASGKPSRELASVYNVSFKQITNWVHRFENHGIEGLKNKKRKGRKPLLSIENLEQIKNIILNDVPANYGFNSEKWTGPILTEYIKKEFGITYQYAQIYNVLRKIGIVFRKKKGFILIKQMCS